MSKVTIVWFRRDLRLDDNLAFIAANKRGNVIPVFISPYSEPSSSSSGSSEEQLKSSRGLPEVKSTENESPWEGQDWAPSCAAKWWLEKSIQALSNELSKLGMTLILKKGPILSALLEVCIESQACSVFWNTHPHQQPNNTKIDTINDERLAMDLSNFDITTEIFSSDLLFGISEISKSKARKPFKSFDNFFRVCSSATTSPPHDFIHIPPRQPFNPKIKSLTLDQLNILKSNETTDNSDGRILFYMERIWTPGYDGAIRRLVQFLTRVLLAADSSQSVTSSNLSDDACSIVGPDMEQSRSVKTSEIVETIFGMYQRCQKDSSFLSTFASVEEGQITLDGQLGSLLSAHLRFGEISARRILDVIHVVAKRDGRRYMQEFETKFVRKLVRRDYAYHLSHHYPHMSCMPLNCKFNVYPWSSSSLNMLLWERGNTGYPIIDAGIRCLKSTGYIPDEISYLVAVFLVKYLCIPWQAGVKFFWEHLCSADLALVTYCWQLVTSSLPGEFQYFLQFDVIEDGKKFDSEGKFIRQWVPELKGLSSQVIHTPWNIHPTELLRHEIILGSTYPHPIVAFDSVRTMSNHAKEMMCSAHPVSVVTNTVAKTSLSMAKTVTNFSSQVKKSDGNSLNLENKCKSTPCFSETKTRQQQQQQTPQSLFNSLQNHSLSQSTRDTGNLGFESRKREREPEVRPISLNINDNQNTYETHFQQNKRPHWLTSNQEKNNTNTQEIPSSPNFGRSDLLETKDRSKSYDFMKRQGSLFNNSLVPPPPSTLAHRHLHTPSTYSTSTSSHEQSSHYHSTTSSPFRGDILQSFSSSSRPSNENKLEKVSSLDKFSQVSLPEQRLQRIERISSPTPPSSLTSLSTISTAPISSTSSLSSSLISSSESSLFQKINDLQQRQFPQAKSFRISEFTPSSSLFRTSGV